jgi:glutaredoxin-like protein NrdH
MSTKRYLDREGITYDVVDLSQHPEQVEVFKAQGLLQAPIVTTDIKAWSGFRLDKLKSLVSAIKSEQAKA